MVKKEPCETPSTSPQPDDPNGTQLPNGAGEPSDRKPVVETSAGEMLF